MRISTHLRRLFHHHHHRHLTSPPSIPSPFIPQHHHFPPSITSLLLKPFSSSTSNDQIALSLSSELQTQDSLSLSKRLDLSFSHVTLTSSLILQTLNNSPDVGRSAFDFFTWLSSKSSDEFHVTDEVYSFFADYFGRRKDFKMIHQLLVDGKGVVGDHTFSASIDRLIRAGRETQAVSFFEKMENDYGIVRNKERFKLLVKKLCEHGHANCAEKMVKTLANEFFPDEYVCDLLIKGWCVDGKLDEARRLAREMYRGGFEIGTVAYNSILDCVCKLCREKDPFRLRSEAENVLVDMDVAGVPRNTETFNVLVSNLCKVRMTEEAVNLFYRMGEWGCSPDATTFIVITKSLYQAARVEEGDEMIDRMKSSGFGGELDKKVYYGFLKILCGIERVEHALKLFSKMKEDGCKPGVKSYELLIRKMYARGWAEKGKALFNEAARNGVEIEPKDYKVDPRFLKKPKVVKKKGKKRLTLPEKTALKRKNLKKLNLSFVKKPRKMMGRMY